MCTTQHGAILTIFPLYLQTTTIVQMLPIGGEGETDVQQGNHRLQTPPRVATCEVTLTARKVVLCVRWPATGITAHSLQPSPRLRVHCASAGR